MPAIKRGGIDLTKDEMIAYWVATAENDYNTMINLYNSKDYHWSLFIGHLVLEKLLKALYVAQSGAEVPKIHDLLRLSEKANLDLTEEQKDLMDLVTSFNIAARYPDYKQSFHNKCTLEFTTESLNAIKEMREWLLKTIKNR